MLTTTQNVRAPRSTLVLWKWTGVSAVLHVLLVGALCGVSYLGFAQRETAERNKAAAAEADAKKAEAAEAAKTTPAPAHPTDKPSAPPVASTSSTPSTQSTATPPPEPTLPPTPNPDQPPSAEKILGIDKTAKPSETPKSPFSGSNDDLLKDLK